MDNYNFRLYAIRRVKLGFQINRNLAGYVSLLCDGTDKDVFFAFGCLTSLVRRKTLHHECVLRNSSYFFHFPQLTNLHTVIILSLHQSMQQTYNNQTLIYISRNEADLAFREGQENLDILRRQVVLGSLYPSAKSVMENSA